MTTFTAHSRTGRTITVENNSGGFVRELIHEEEGVCSVTYWPSIAGYESYLLGETKGQRATVKQFKHRKLVSKGRIEG